MILEKQDAQAVFAPLPDGRVRVIAKGLAYLAIVLSFVVLAWWTMNSTVLAQLHAGIAAMVPSTAPLMVLSAIILVVGLNNWPPAVTAVCIALIFCLVLVDQFIYFDGQGGTGSVVLRVGYRFGHEAHVVYDGDLLPDFLRRSTQQEQDDKIQFDFFRTLNCGPADRFG